MSQPTHSAFRSQYMMVLRVGLLWCVLAGLLWYFAAPVKAEERSIRWAQEGMGYVCSWSGECWKRYPAYRQTHERRHTHTHTQYGSRYRPRELERYPPAEYYTVRPRGYDYHADVREDYDDRFDDRRGHRDEEQCRPPVRVLSTEHSEEGSAKDAATKIWMAETQDRHGTRYMDLMNAHDIRWRCGASNAHDTFSGRWSEGIAKAQGKDGQNVRCRLWATPCLAPMVREEKSRRDR